MDATRKNTDSAVSPVIAVILMVAITVVLAAAVYVWVTGFTPTGEGAPPSLGLSQGQQLTTNATLAAQRCTAGATWCANFTVTSTSANLFGSRLRPTDQTTNVGTLSFLVNGAPGTSTTPLHAGDVLSLYGTGTPAASGDALAFADRQTETVITTMILR